jgi:hypothetical protein
MSPPEDRFVPRFAAEPPQDLLPYGRWGEKLQQEFLAACLHMETEGEDLGDVGEPSWYPDRSWHGRTFVPVTATTANGFEVYGFVSYAHGGANEEPDDFHAIADFTEETADVNPSWQIDLCDMVIGEWRGEQGKAAAMTLVWGRPLVEAGVVATAELADLAVDQCLLVEGRFTLIAPDDYRGDTLDVKLFDRRGSELARESLYAEDDEDQ